MGWVPVTGFKSTGGGRGVTDEERRFEKVSVQNAGGYLHKGKKGREKFTYVDYVPLQVEKKETQISSGNRARNGGGQRWGPPLGGRGNRKKKWSALVDEKPIKAKGSRLDLQGKKQFQNVIEVGRKIRKKTTRGKTDIV